MGQTPTWSLLSTYHWPELSYGARPPCERPWDRAAELSARRERKWALASVSVIMPLLASGRHEIWTLAVWDQRLTLHQHILPPHHEQWLKAWEKCGGLHQFFLSFLPTYNCMWLPGCCAWEFCQSCYLQKTITMRTDIECLLCSRHGSMHFTCSALFNRHNYPGDRELLLVPFSRQGSWLCVQGHVSKQCLWAPKGPYAKPRGTRWGLKGRENEKARHTVGPIQNPARTVFGSCF